MDKMMDKRTKVRFQKKSYKAAGCARDIKHCADRIQMLMNGFGDVPSCSTTAELNEVIRNAREMNSLAHKLHTELAVVKDIHIAHTEGATV